MVKRYAFVAIAVIVVLGACAAVVLHKDKYQVRITKVQVEQDIRAHLPIGSSRKEVAAYLDSNRFPHSYIEDLMYSKCKSCEIALIRDTAHNWLIRTDIQLEFRFDQAGRLASYSMQEINTGP
jgi:hypothetical protein